MPHIRTVLTKDEVRGPTWDDVREHLRLASRATGRAWYVKSSPFDGNVNRKAGMRWTVVATRSKDARWQADDRMRWTDWPTSQHKTVPGLLVRLIHELRASWEEEEQAKQAGLPF